MFHEGYLSDTLGLEACRKLREQGVTVLSEELPWFPDGSVPPVPQHRYDAERWLTGMNRHYGFFALHSVLVPRMRVFARCRARWMELDDEKFRPYWTGPLVVVYDGAPLPDPKYWRSATALETVAAFSQHASCGSLRCADPVWNGCSLGNMDTFNGPKTVQAYYWDEMKAVVLDTHGSSPYHNRIFVRRGTSGDPYPFYTLNPV